LQALELQQLVVEKTEDLKARDIVILDIADSSTVTDYMVICTGNSKQHVRSIAEHVALEMKKINIPPLGVEGQSAGEWVLVDLGSVVVHVMQNGIRDFYQLEKLWTKTDGSNSVAHKS